MLCVPFTTDGVRRRRTIGRNRLQVSGLLRTVSIILLGYRLRSAWPSSEYPLLIYPKAQSVSLSYRVLTSSEPKSSNPSPTFGKPFRVLLYHLSHFILAPPNDNIYQSGKLYAARNGTLNTGTRLRPWRTNVCYSHFGTFRESCSGGDSES